MDQAPVPLPSDSSSEVERARQEVARARSITVLSGAGISTSTGIPDFRGPNGVWTRDPEAEKMAHIRYYLDDPAVRRRSWANRLSSPIWSATPSAAHVAVADLAAAGQLRAVITQNIDGLHQKAGLDPALVVEIHGSAHTVVCWSCGASTSTEQALARVRAGEEDPACRVCGGILKTATISFGQNLDVGVLERATRAAAECDVMLAVGSSLTVHPAAALVPWAVKNGATVVIVNGEPTPYDHLAAAVVRQSIDEVLPRIVAAATGDAMGDAGRAPGEGGGGR